METYKLEIVGQSADLKLSPTKSKDTGVFIPSDLMTFLGWHTTSQVSLRIFKKDCVKSAVEILSHLPLYSSKSGRPIVHDDIISDWSDYSKMIEGFFGSEDSRLYTGSPFSISETTNERNYLYKLEQEGFNVRKLFVAGKTIAHFSKDENGNVTMRFETNFDQSSSTTDHTSESVLSVDQLPDHSNILTALPLQQIFYGAPGTGKSHKTNEITREYSDTIRTTFHPDSDYSTFVGAYKPTTTEECVYGLNGDKTICLKDVFGNPLKTSKIEYKFIPQAFIKAYIQAWKKMTQMTITTHANFNGQPIILQSNKSHLSWKITEIKSQDIYLESSFKLATEDFKKSAKDLWDKAWKSGEYTQDVFTSFTRYEQTICNWIYQDIGTNDFEAGWDRLIAELNNGTLELRVNPFKDSKQKPYYYRLEGDNIIINAMLHTTYDDLYDYFEKDKEPSKYQQAVGNLLASYSNDYDEAWKKLEEELKQVDGSRYTIKVESQFLVIEEINRGNCAQIFGDLFQLLDRTKNGFSEYPIEADEDISKYIKEELKELAFNQEIIDYINQQFVDGDMNPLTYDIDDNRVYALDAILNGKILVLPANLYIWATMNTSDQSLFPIDSAFKRRWDWEYMPIHDAGKNWKIKVGETTYDWWKFIDAINEQINTTTSSEDKKLGYFFCKPCEGDNILATKFVNKVIFYLWNDVFKDYELPVAFNYGDSKKKTANSPSDHMSFNDFYTDKNACIHQLMKNLKVQPDGQAEEPEVIEEPTEEIEA